MDLNYEELVNGYYENLQNNLRNFKGGPGFLETWVHDEDHNRSLLEILHLAHSSQVNKLKIQLTAGVQEKINLQTLRHQIRDFGSLELQGAALIYADRQFVNTEHDPFELVNPIYRIGLASHNIAYESPVQNSRLIVERAQEGSGELCVALDTEGVVQEAKHGGFESPQRQLMDMFCSELLHRSLHEGAEHCAIRVEQKLRNSALSSSIKGLLTPLNADPMFAVPTRLVRQLFRKYVERMGQQPGKNLWRDPIPEVWKKTADTARLQEAQAYLQQGCQSFGLQSDVQVIDIKNDTRFVLAFTQDVTQPDVGLHMIKLERWMRSKLHFEVELQLESVEDRNKRVERTRGN